MTDLLDFALQAHGGLQRWKSFSRLQAEISIGGAIWEIKQQPGLLTDKVFDLLTREERVVITPFTEPDRVLEFTPGRMSLKDTMGRTVEERVDPIKSFEGQVRETPWDKFHAAYFAGEAMWTYLNSPWLYTLPGFVTEEIEPWEENGEEWRRLKITFPDTVTSHTRTQITHFGPDGLMRRHDYTVDILGGATGANYPSGYHEVQGLMMPSQRRIFAYDEHNRKVPEPLLVSLDFGALTFR